MEKLFLQILNMSVSATYLILAVVVIRFFRSKMPKWVSVLLWGLVAVRLLCPFTPESMFSLIPKTQAVSPEILAPEVPNTNLDGGSFESGEIGTMGEIAGTGVIGDIPVSPPVVGGDSLPPASVGNAEEPIRLIAVLAVIWAVGVVVMLVYVAFGYGRIRKKIGTAIPMGNGVYQSDHINSAFVLGILKPKIYLPFSLQEKNLNHVVAHERAHIRRMDHLWKPLGFLLLAVHWFNPFMWVAFTLFCQDVEMACDEKVIAKFDYMERAAYSEALLSCSVKRRKKFAYPLTFGEIDTKGRVKSVLNYKKPKFWVMFLSLICCVVVAVCFLTNPVSGDDETEQETTLENDTGDTTETPPLTPMDVYGMEGEFINHEGIYSIDLWCWESKELPNNNHPYQRDIVGMFITTEELDAYFEYMWAQSKVDSRVANYVEDIEKLQENLSKVNFETHSIIAIEGPRGLEEFYKIQVSDKWKEWFQNQPIGGFEAMIRNDNEIRIRFTEQGELVLARPTKPGRTLFLVVRKDALPPSDQIQIIYHQVKSYLG